MNTELNSILKDLKSGILSVEEASVKIKSEPFVDTGYAKIDLQRKMRKGTSEIIYGEGKSAEQITGICKVLTEKGQKPILITRLTEDKAEKLRIIKDSVYYKEAKIMVVGSMPQPTGIGRIVITTGGTSDIPVAEEAAVTAEFLGNEVMRLYDVGVAGIHRTLAHMEDIMSASCIIAIAGMEGALASVIGGLADCPVIAVPTSIGYGASFGGLSALLSMLNSCASGVTVVNIDNGFGAAYFASMVNHMK